MPYTYQYPRPAVTVDCVIFGYRLDDTLKVLLIQRRSEPFGGQWALPGGFVDLEEDLEVAALRELEEETGVRDVFVEQLYTFGTPGRDPRGRVISVAYYALVNLQRHPVQAASDADRADWFDVHDLPILAFDHAQILAVAHERLQTKVRYQPIGFELLPEEFTLTQLQQLYECILDVPGGLNKRNFRKRILDMDILTEAGRQQQVAHRPAMRYRFDREKYEQLVRERATDLLKRGMDFGT